MEKKIKGKKELVNRPDFRFLKTYYHMLLQLKTDEEKFDFLMAIINRQFCGIEPTLEGNTSFAYAAIKYHVDKSLDGFGHYWNTETPTLDPITPPMIDPIILPIIDPIIQIEEEEEKKEEEKEEVKKEKIKKTKNELGGFGKLLEVFPTTKVHSEHECLAIWDSLTQGEKQKVIKHSSVYVRELTKKNEIQFMKNLKSYLESRMWENVSPSMKKKDFGRGMTKGGIDGKFVQWVSRQTERTFDESIKELALMSDEDYKEIRSIYEEETQNG